MQLVCKYCGKEFSGRSTRKYCSKSCSSKATYGKPKYDFDTQRIAISISPKDKDYVDAANVQYGYVFSLGVNALKLKDFKKRNLKLVPLWIVFLVLGAFLLALTPYIFPLSVRFLLFTIGCSWSDCLSYNKHL